jgi:hypothetical protein
MSDTCAARWREFADAHSSLDLQTRRLDASVAQTRANKWIKQESDQEGVMNDEKWNLGGR